MTNVLCQCDLCVADSAVRFAWKWGKLDKIRLISNVLRACDIGLGGRVTIFASNWAKEPRKRFFNVVPFSCNLLSVEAVLTFASRWVKDVNRSLVSNSHLRRDPRWSDVRRVSVFKWAKEVHVIFAYVRTITRLHDVKVRWLFYQNESLLAPAIWGLNVEATYIL